MRDQEIIGLWEAYSSIYAQTKENQEVIFESQIGDRARKVVGDQRQGVHGDADAIKQDMDAINLNLRKMRGFPNGFPSVKKDDKKTTQVAHFEPEMDLFDVILEYLVAEGFADTNENALVIMANMSEDWRQNIVETIAGGGYTPNPVGNAIRTGAGLLKGVMSNPSVQGAIKTGSEMLKKKAPTGGYSTRPGDGKPYADGPLWGPGSGDAPKQPQRKPQAPMRDEPLW